MNGMHIITLKFNNQSFEMMTNKDDFLKRKKLKMQIKKASLKVRTESLQVSHKSFREYYIFFSYLYDTRVWLQPTVKI